MADALSLLAGKALATSPPHNPSDVSLTLETKPLASSLGAESTTSSTSAPNLPLSPPTEPSQTPSIVDSVEANDARAMDLDRLSSEEPVIVDEDVPPKDEPPAVDAAPVESAAQTMDVDTVESALPPPDSPAASPTDSQTSEVPLSQQISHPDKTEEAPVAAAPIPTAAPAPVAAPASKLTPSEVKGCKSILTSLNRHNSAWPFKAPVDPVVAQAPDYYTIIKRPMDLQTAGQKLAKGEYETLTAFVDDIKLMFDNCYLYNPSTHFVHQSGLQLEKYFGNLLNRTFPALPVYNRPSLSGLPGPAAAPKKAPKAPKRKRAGVTDEVIVASPVAEAPILVDSVVPAPVAAPEVVRPARERRPKKIYEPEEVDAANGGKRRKSSIAGKSSKKKDADGSDMSTTLMATMMALQKQLESGKDKKRKKGSQTEVLMAGLTAAMLTGLMKDQDSSDSSDDEAAKKNRRKSSGSAPVKKRSKSSLPRVGATESGGMLVEDLDGGAASNAVAGARRCEHCGSVAATKWKPGPSGDHTLCGKCGSKWEKQEARRRKSVEGTAASVSAPALSEASLPTPRTITTDERVKLGELIGGLHGRHTQGILDIIRSSLPADAPEHGEVELDLEAIDSVTFQRLYGFAVRCAEEDRKASEKAKVAARKAAAALRRDREGGSSSSSSSDDSSGGSDSD
ncbi:hypothetical protein HDU96_010673 [Phlyctochytrium bullatum]|nr:hypothetical protein HDU96_010673 [Phlyctochytrium bullatum]